MLATTRISEGLRLGPLRAGIAVNLTAGSAEALASASARFGAHLVGKGDEANLATASARTGLQSLGVGVVVVIVGFERDGLTVVGCTSEGTADVQARRPSAASAQNLAVSEHRGGSAPGERGP